MHRELPQQRTSVATDRLLQTGARRTTARVAVIETLAGADTHLSIGQIHEQVHSRHEAITLSTVHRTVGFLLAHEIVHVLAWPWEALYGLADARHSHIICIGCGSVGEIDPELLEPASQSMRAGSGFALLHGGQTLLGHCARCQLQASSARKVEAAEAGSWYPGHVLTPLAKS